MVANAKPGTKSVADTTQEDSNTWSSEGTNEYPESETSSYSCHATQWDELTTN